MQEVRTRVPVEVGLGILFDLSVGWKFPGPADPVSLLPPPLPLQGQSLNESGGWKRTGINKFRVYSASRLALTIGLELKRPSHRSRSSAQPPSRSPGTGPGRRTLGPAPDSLKAEDIASSIRLGADAATPSS